MALLDDVRQLVRDQPLVSVGLRVGRPTDVDMRAARECACAERFTWR